MQSYIVKEVPTIITPSQLARSLLKAGFPYKVTSFKILLYALKIFREPDLCWVGSSFCQRFVSNSILAGWDDLGLQDDAFESVVGKTSASNSSSPLLGFSEIWSGIRGRWPSSNSCAADSSGHADLPIKLANRMIPASCCPFCELWVESEEWNI